jgi:alpha-tubulin suppressor-like RCC1 family protein
MKSSSPVKLIVGGVVFVGLLVLVLFAVFPKEPAASSSVVIAPVGIRVATPKMVGNWGRILFIASDGTLWGWGDSISGELGIQTNQACGPRQFSREQSWRDIATGCGFTLGIKSDGTLWAWGMARYLARSADPTKPALVGSDTNWLHVAAGASHYVLQKTDGTLWTWGANNEGQLGDGTTQDSPAAIQIGSGPWMTFAVGAFHSAAIAPNGTLWDWGRHSAGGGTGLAQVGNETNWVAIASGEYLSLAQKSDGSWWIWGDNAAFINPAAVTTPTKLPGTETWSMVAGGNGHAVAIGRDGKLWTVGRNFQGELGDGTRAEQKKPVRIGVATNWIAAAAATSTSAAMSSDGAVFIWGVRSDIPSRTRYDSDFWRLVGGVYKRLGGRRPTGAVMTHSDSATPVKLMEFKLTPAQDVGISVHTNRGATQPSGKE